MKPMIPFCKRSVSSISGEIPKELNHSKCNKKARQGLFRKTILVIILKQEVDVESKSPYSFFFFERKTKKT